MYSNSELHDIHSTSTSIEQQISIRENFCHITVHTQLRLNPAFNMDISLLLNPLVEDDMEVEMEVEKPNKIPLLDAPIPSHKPTPTPLPYRPTSPVIPVNWFPSSKAPQDKPKKRSSVGSRLPKKAPPQRDCPKCGKTLSCSYMKDHMRNFHHPDTKFPCQECSERFVNEQELEHHTEKVHPKVFLCKKCGKDFPDNNFLVSHYRFKHSELKSVLVHLPKDSEHDTRMEDVCGQVWESHM
jgi:DNA-directed RNA polymerase subunit M/transcription elongation factor TFIIS